LNAKHQLAANTDLFYSSHMNQLKYLHIAIDRGVYGLFDYLPPKQPTPIKPGMRVLVPFGRAQVLGFVVGAATESNIRADKLKHIAQVLDETPLLCDHILKLGAWMARYYHYSLGQTLASMVPTALKKNTTQEDATPYFFEVTVTTKTAKTKAQKALIAWIAAQTQPVDQHRLSYSPFSLRTAQALIKQGLLTTCATPKKLQSQPTNSKTLNPEQQQAVTNINQETTFKVHLLQGITGSGKTEVYLHCIATALNQGKQVLLIVPEIGLTPQMLRRLEARFQQPIRTIHSGLNEQQRLLSWSQAQQKHARLIVGTRCALFTPMPDLGLIVVDESHDTALKQHSMLRYHARDVAIMRAKMLNIRIILGTATPSLESLFNCRLPHYQHHNLQHRATGAQLPTVQCLDIKGQKLDHGLACETKEIIAQHLNNNKQVMVFLNRRGYAPVFLCHECSWSAHCPHCDSHMTYHRHKEILRCHHCDYSSQTPKQCPECHQAAFVPIGLGTEQLQAQLQEYYPETPVIRIDRDTVRPGQSLDAHLEKCPPDQASILVGTQMLAKGHHWPKLTLVVVLDIDQSLYCSDFRAIEHMGQLLTQVSGRAGRAADPGHVIIQTHHPQHPDLQCLLKDGYTAFAHQLLSARHTNNLPPFCHHALLQCDAKTLQQAMKTLSLIAQHLKKQPCNLLGPTPSIKQKKKGRYHASLTIQCSNKQQRAQTLHYLAQLNLKYAHYVVDVDPIQCL
jgi:primosomal protein N' (replication factor Y) (superfamily II helicase)